MARGEPFTSLSITESHLSAEASRPSAPPVPPLDEQSGKTARSADSTTVDSERTLEESHEGVGKDTGDLEKGGKGAAETAEGVIVVDWDGPDDPAFPKNWSNGTRMASTLVVASFTFLSPLSSTMIAPASMQVAARLNIVDDVEISMITSIFVLAYAFGPLVFGPASELWGRVIVLQLANVLYLIFNFVCAFATTKTQFFIFRFLAGLGGSAPLSIGAGVLGDLWRPEERGRAAALYSLGPLLGPAVGPVAGGWIAEKVPLTGYRWVFFATTIFCTLVQLVGFFYLKETYAPTLLHRLALKKKKELGLPKDSDRVLSVFELKDAKKTVGHIISHGMVRPFTLLWHEHIIQILALFMALIYGIIYISLTATTGIFVDLYGQSVGIAGTHFISQGLGFFIWSQTQGRILDWGYQKLKARNGGEGKPEYRLPLMIPGSIFLPFGLLLYGWGAQERLHWITIDIGMGFIAAGMISVFQCVNTYLIDAFTLHAASALAAATFLRSLFGFGAPLFAPYMFDAIGYGGGCTLLAALVIVIGWPATPVLFIYGERIRQKSRHAVKKTTST